MRFSGYGVSLVLQHGPDIWLVQSVIAITLAQVRAVSAGPKEFAKKKKGLFSASIFIRYRWAGVSGRSPRDP